LVAAADLIKSALSEFRLIVIGDGPSVETIKKASETRPWMHWVGMCKGSEKAAFFRLAEVILNPGLVGLHILDSFCAGVPMVTTSDARHSPEIAYLKNGENGVVVQGGVSDYAKAVVLLLQSPTVYRKLQAGALASAEKYTLTTMVERFTSGVEACLSQRKKILF